MNHRINLLVGLALTIPSVLILINHPFLSAPIWFFPCGSIKKDSLVKIVQKHYTLEMKKRLEKSGRDFLSKTEKKEIKDHVIHLLNLRIPATPNIYDLIWNYESNTLWFFSNLKGANEELETLFTRSFKLKLIRWFPYSMATLTSSLSDMEKDVVFPIHPNPVHGVGENCQCWMSLLLITDINLLEMSF